MGGFARKVKRHVAKGLGLIESRGKTAKRKKQLAASVRWVWCSKCLEVVTSQDGLRQVSAPDGSGKIELRCKKCDTLINLRRWHELPDGTPQSQPFMRVTSEVTPYPVVKDEVPPPSPPPPEAKVEAPIAAIEAPAAVKDEGGSDAENA